MDDKCEEALSKITGVRMMLERAADKGYDLDQSDCEVGAKNLDHAYDLIMKSRDY